jgi:hypothetical protein
MNQALETLAREIALDADEPLRLQFALACMDRVGHLLEEPRAIELLQVLRKAVEQGEGVGALAAAAREGTQLARSHRGHVSIDGSGHSAVSATHALANALAGRAVQTADYAAYAAVYAYGRYAANDPDAFEPEFRWQVDTLKRLHEETHGTTAAHRDRRLLG